LSAFMHPGYISMYCAFALMIFIYLVKINELKFNWKWGIAVLLLVVYILLLSSKAGWVGLCLIILYLVRNMILKKHASYAILIISILLGLFFVINIYFTPSYSARIPKLSVISQTLKDLDNKQKNAEITDGTRSRILVWKSATEIIKDNFLFGVGTGDAKDKMLEKYLEKGMITEYKNKLNSHNQFLNVFVALGVVGFLALFLSLLTPFYFSIKKKRIILAGFVILTGINFLFESMLETQAGVLFYAFFNTVLCYGYFENEPGTKDEMKI
jgi:O-antigen ligase